MSAPAYEGQATTRDSYATVGAALRQAIDRANRAGLSGGEQRVLLAVVALVSSYSRLRDRVYVFQIAAATGGLSERHTRTCLEKLARQGIIYWEPRRGHGVQSIVGLPPLGESGSHAVPVSHAGMNGRRIPAGGHPR